MVRSILTYACLRMIIRGGKPFVNCSVCEAKFSAPLEIYQGAQWPPICTWRSKLHTYTISL